VVDKSLVTADTSERVTRYRLLGPMRAYGLEMLSAAGEREAAERFFAMWSLDFARLAHAAWETESSTGWSALVEPELDNLRASVLWALEDGYDVELGQRIVATIRRIWARFVPAEGRRWIEAGRQAVHETTSPEIRASLSIAEAHVYTALEQYSTAFNAAKECESYFVAAGDDLSLAEARGFAGLALIFTGDSAEGERLIASSVHVYQQRGAKQLAAYGVSDLGISHLIRGDLPGARKLFQKALRAFRDLGNERGASSVAANLAEVEFCTGADREAVRLCQEALALSQTGREARMYLANLAAYLVRLEQYDEARERARQSIMCSGIERADADVACALQHLAAVAALRASSPVPGDTSAAVPSDTATDDLVISAARLSGFVDSRLAALEKIREYTEQQEYERLVVALESRFGTERLEELRDQGQAWTEDDAVSAALRI
jgi:tetratricopeptide (TPR) repeat protein